MSAPASIKQRTDEYTAPNYARQPVVFVRGEGRYLWDEDGKRYLDLLSGLGVSSLGHGHAGLVSAIREQAGTLLHASNLYYTKPAAALAERLVAETFADRVFFCNSGAEANEAAIKMARRAAGDRYEIVCVDGSFHGRTLATLAATGQPALREGFGPIPEGFVHVDAGDAAAVEAVVGERTAAVMVEPILGESGVVVPPAGYLAALRKICDERGALLILDEVQTGNGRTGKLYCHEHDGIVPDVLTTAKGLAGGMPIGAVLATDAVASVFVPGTHGSTFGANPVSCAAANAVLHALLDEGVLDNAARMGARLTEGLENLLGGRDDVVSVRGRGLMIGVEFREPAAPLVARLLEAGVVANAAGGTVLRMLPPLTITNGEVDEALDTLRTVLDEA